MHHANGISCFTRRFSRAIPAGTAEGRSLRYTAMVLLGARQLSPAQQRVVLGERSVAELCTTLIRLIDTSNSVGDAALALWAAAALRHGDLGHALDRLDALDGDAGGGTAGPRYVVDAAWVVAGLVEARPLLDVEQRLARARARLLGSRQPSSPLFGHVTGPGLGPAYRSHLACFADQVYPIQALARLHASAADPEALAVADACADRVCALQGDAGQWWWHYDARTGDLIEGYPVYSVHQHAMAPMALLDLAEAGGQARWDAVLAGLQWLVQRPELAGPMIHDEYGLTTRKVARNDPKKLVRGLRVASTGRWPGHRLAALDRLFPPTAVDRECRPYEFGWLLDCWLGGRLRPEPAPDLPQPAEG